VQREAQAADQARRLHTQGAGLTLDGRRPRRRFQASQRRRHVKDLGVLGAIERGHGLLQLGEHGPQAAHFRGETRPSGPGALWQLADCRANALALTVQARLDPLLPRAPRPWAFRKKFTAPRRFMLAGDYQGAPCDPVGSLWNFRTMPTQFLAATNKCLAQSNKSRTRDKATTRMLAPSVGTKVI